MIMSATAADIRQLDGLYKDSKAYYGDLHNHAATGGTSDGKLDLAGWKRALKSLNLNFAGILDHRQVRHMFLPEWEDGTFVCGTEPGTKITDTAATRPYLHYNMIFSSAQPLMKLLTDFPEFEYAGGPEDHFVYPEFTTARFCELIDAVKAHGGFFVHPHPKQNMQSEDPCDYWFRDETGLEVFYNGADRQFEEHTSKNYDLWTQLLAKGKRIWACSGGDEHAEPTGLAITTIYASGYHNAAYLERLRVGDFVCGSVGIQMCMGDTAMGGQCNFDTGRLVVCIKDFHSSVFNPDHQYRVDILNENGVVISAPVSCQEPAYFALYAEPCNFYRAEVFDTTANKRIAIGNPIWNLK